MGFPINFNGALFDIPAYNDLGWAQYAGNVTQYLIAIASGTLQTSGGNFTLTSPLNLGPNFGVEALYVQTETTPSAVGGFLRLGNVDTINFRSAQNNGDLVLGVNTANQITYNSVPLGVSIQGGTFSTPVWTPNGTPSNPTHAFVSDIKTGAYLVGTSNFAVSVGGTQLIDVTPTGLTVSGSLQISGPFLPAGLAGNSGQLLTSGGSTAVPTWSNAVTSVSNTDGSLTINPTSGNAVASLNPAHANSWSGQQSFTQPTLEANGLVSGPAYSYTADSKSGEYLIGVSNIGLAVGGAQIGSFTPTGATFTTLQTSLQGSTGFPSYSFTADRTSGAYLVGTSNIAISSGGIQTASFGPGGPTFTGNMNVTGTIAFTSALLPNSLPGTTGSVLTSQGVSKPPIWANTGKIIQLLQTTSSTIKSTTSNTYQATNLSGTITPTSSNSKIIIFVSAVAGDADINNGSCIITLKRGATDLDPSGGNGFIQLNGAVTTSYSSGASFMYVDSPASTSALTYQCYIKNSDNATSVTFGTNSSAQIMILAEIGV